MFRLAYSLRLPLNRGCGLSTSPFGFGGGDGNSGLSPVRRRAALEERFLAALRDVHDPLLSGLPRAPDVVSQG
jgi:hypothetical protein